MSIFRIRTEAGAEAAAGPATGGGMDKPVQRRGLDLRIRLAAAILLVLLAAAAFVHFAPGGNSQTVEQSRVTASTVIRGRFDDFLPLRARVTPLVTVLLDAVEGGRVEQVLAEDGAMVQQGQLLAILSNSDLQLNLLARQSSPRPTQVSPNATGSTSIAEKEL